MMGAILGNRTMAVTKRLSIQPARKARSLWKNDRGVAMLEFALLAPVFFGILAAIMQTAMVFLASQFLESAVHNSSRTIRTGTAQQTNWSLADFRNTLCDGLYSLVNCNNLHIEVDVLNNFAAANVEPPYDRSCEEDCGWTRPEKWVPGPASSIVLVQVHYKFPLILPFAQLASNALPDGSMLLGSATVFRNEPY